MTHNGLADLIFTGVRVLIEKRYRGQHQPRGTKAALDRAFFYEGFLNGVEAAGASAESLNRQDFLALSFNCKIEARVDGFAVKKNCASAALALLA
jgi:hypothetical protein